MLQQYLWELFNVECPTDLRGILDVSTSLNHFIQDQFRHDLIYTVFEGYSKEDVDLIGLRFYYLCVTIWYDPNSLIGSSGELEGCWDIPLQDAVEGLLVAGGVEVSFEVCELACHCGAGLIILLLLGCIGFANGSYFFWGGLFTRLYV